MNAQIKAGVVTPLRIIAVLIRAISPALQAPLRPAVSVVQSIILRQVRQMNLSRIIGLRDA